ncbi:hypothetical protein RCL1_006759 [Eukaryota sp. TZLM3-RCL]
MLDTDGTKLIDDDAYLKPYASDFKRRHQKFLDKLQVFQDTEGGIEQLSLGFHKFGLHKIEGGISYFEWAPDARAVSLIGDFNNWDRNAHPCTRDEFGRWSLFLADKDGQSFIPHNSKVRAALLTSAGEWVDRVPAWITYAQQAPGLPMFNGIFWNPPREEQHIIRHPKPIKKPTGGLRIYEAHVGMATEEYRVGSYREFADLILPHVAEYGYNAVQLMAVMEHAYYASFGYHVTSFFAPASRSGTPDDFKYLVDKAHELGLIILLDIIHSHAAPNVLDGLNMFDGSDSCYFHAGAPGRHDLWGSRLFDYQRHEVLRFLLSNARYWVDEYKVDGFRFDGVTSMLYHHHGIGTGFSGNYSEYFGFHVDEDAITYLKLVNFLLHSLYPDIITIAEDVSGMPGLCRPIADGGLGFDYRLGMAIPDMWIALLKEVPDEHWNMGKVVHTLTNRRYKEKTISYSESHDQAIVGDKTLAFWLMDADMYSHMSILTPTTDRISRGLALHKMIRLISQALGGEGYLCFMGNEFGHPEWIDFPREGNNGSYHYCRRQWSLMKDPLLRYQHLGNFDIAMNNLAVDHDWIGSNQYVSLAHEEDKVIVFEKKGETSGKLTVFAFNFNPVKSFESFPVPVRTAGRYRLFFNSDRAEYGGYSRLIDGTVHFTEETHVFSQPRMFRAYLPTRTVLAFELLPENS